MPAAGDCRALLAPCPNARRARHEPRAAPAGGRAGRTRCRRSRPRGRRALRGAGARRTAGLRRTTAPWPSSAPGSTTCRSRSSSPPRACGVFTAEQLLERLGAAARPAQGRPRRRPAPGARCARRSSGRTTCSTRRSSSCSRASPSSPAAARSRPPRQSATPTWTRCSRSSTRASSAGATDGRFWMLETIREFAAERLEQPPARSDVRAPPRALLRRARCRSRPRDGVAVGRPPSALRPRRFPRSTTSGSLSSGARAPTRCSG